MNFSKINELKPYDLNCNIFDVYSYDGLSMQDLLCQFFTKINECIKTSNETIDLAEWLVNEGLKQEVALKLTTWLNDGTLENIINVTLFENLNKKIDNVSSQVDYNKLQLDNNKQNNRVNIKDYGAIGDWNSHPASEFYSNLEELKKDYPKAQSLDDEMDTLALEKALTSSYKTIYMPYGGYKINRAGFSISENRCIIGDGKTATQLSYTGNDDYVFTINGHNVVIKDFKITAPFTINEKGTTTSTSFINVSKKTHNTFSDLFIVGFNKGIYFGENAWVQYINNVRIQNCNTGIEGNSEFNNICISQCNITYCDLGIYAGGGRNIVIHMCDIERNNAGIKKINNGDIVIRDNYFEFNSNSNIQITWGMSAVDMAIIDGNSFFTSANGEPMILYHSYPNANIVITNNNFQCYNLNDGVVINCLTPTNNTNVQPIFKNNILNEGYAVGVNVNKINREGFYKNGAHVSYTGNTDLSGVLTSDVQTIRLPFTPSGEITLPSFSSLDDSSQCFKMFAFTNSSVTDEQYMTINTSGKSIIGVKKIHPNQIYSIYFNRVSGSNEEVIIVKG